jgi:hypothetical protein
MKEEDLRFSSFTSSGVEIHLSLEEFGAVLGLVYGSVLHPNRTAQVL